MTHGFFLGPNERALTGPAVGGSSAGMIGTASGIQVAVRMKRALQANTICRNLNPQNESRRVTSEMSHI